MRSGKSSASAVPRGETKAFVLIRQREVKVSWDEASPRR
jgi:hypothetical protein